jgi:hypothetical protein
MPTTLTVGRDLVEGLPWTCAEHLDCIRHSIETAEMILVRTTSGDVFLVFGRQTIENSVGVKTVRTLGIELTAKSDLALVLGAVERLKGNSCFEGCNLDRADRHD